MITGAQGKTLEGGDLNTDVGVLQTGCEAIQIGAHIEEVHSTIELVMGAIDGAETLDDFVLRHADLSSARNGKILVTAQEVISCGDTIQVLRFESGLGTRHPSVDSHIILVVAELVVVGCRHCPLLGGEGQVTTQQVLEEGLVQEIVLGALHADVHEQHRHTQREAPHVIVVP